MRVLVTRPDPAGERTAALLRAVGHEPVPMPLSVIEACDWTLPADLPDAVMLTSARAAAAGAAAAQLHRHPAFTVGLATAAAARAAGFVDVRPGAGNVQALVDAAAAAGITHLLHLAGEDRTPFVPPPGLAITVVPVYRARLLPLVPHPEVDRVLLFSARVAVHFAAECDRLGHPRQGISIAALSPAVAAAAGAGWRAMAVAAEPTEAALLAAIGAAWQEPR